MFLNLPSSIRSNSTFNLPPRVFTSTSLKEELGIEAAIGDHVYTTDYFQMSAFRPDDQIISIYYFAKHLEELKVPIREKQFDFDEKQMEIYKNTGETETFRWIDWNDFSEETVTLPIDKIVARMVKNNY